MRRTGLIGLVLLILAAASGCGEIQDLWALRSALRQRFDSVGVHVAVKDGRGLYLHQQAIDTSTPGGRAMFQMMGIFAEFERAMIRERVIAGIERCKKSGKTGPGKKWFGRPLTDPEIVGSIRVLLAQGVGKRRIAKRLGVGVSVVQRVAKS